MDQHRHTLTQLARDLAPYDDDALASLANKGLVRRARKDLEKQPPQLVDSPPPHQFEVEGHQATLTPLPQEWRCSCHSGVCRHLIAAVIHVREKFASSNATPSDSATPSPTPVPVDPTSEILALSDEQIQAWAGKSFHRKALLLASETIQINRGTGWLGIRFPHLNIESKWLAGKPIDAMLCSCHAPAPCEHRVAALLAFRAQVTGQVLQVPTDILKAADGAARTRPEIVAAVQSLLCETIAQGLCRISSATVERLDSLAVSAHGVDLPRLSRTLSAIAAETRLRLARNAATHTGILLTTLSATYALSLALQSPTPTRDAVGVHRSTYKPVAGSLDLTCAGVRRWETRSGYHGLTLYFYDHASACFTSYSASRRLDQPGLEPARQYLLPGPWSGFPSPKSATLARWRFTGLWQNPDRRLSGRDSTSVTKLPSASPLPAITDFSQLGPIIDAAFPAGLANANEHAPIVLLQPAAWSAPVYDPLEQSLTLAVKDTANRILQLRLHYSDLTSHGIENLEKLQILAPSRLLGFLRLHTGQFVIEPITLHLPDKNINLTLDFPTVTFTPAPAAETAPADSSAPDSQADEPEPPEIETPDASPVSGQSALASLLTLAQARLEDLADAGVRGMHDTARLAAIMSEFNTAGLTLCARSLDQTLTALHAAQRDSSVNPLHAAAAILKSHFLLTQSLQHESLFTARNALA